MHAPIHPLKIDFSLPMPSGQAMARFVYCYLIFADRVTVVDTGIDGAETAIFAAVEAAGRPAEALDTVFLTHAHPDHIGSAATIRADNPVTILAHAAERRWIEDVSVQARERPVPHFDRLVAGSVAVDRVVGDGDIVDLGGVEGRVLHTPGHSPGGISLHIPAWNALFTGDALPLPNDMPIYDDVRTYVRSVRRITAVPDVRQLYSAWHPPITDAAEAKAAMAESLTWLQTVHRAVREVARPGDTPEPMALCREVVCRLGLPPFAANPLVARSFLSHLPLLDIEDITAPQGATGNDDEQCRRR